ncbi:MAG TPA: substrate-binding domain-containing protein, partial [Albitalea sp.]|nr:substrate-binding domain-containing protein [Albitalea sp.]
MTSRRHVLACLPAAASLVLPSLAGTAQTRSLADPMRLAADDALVDSGLAAHLLRAFGHDTGIAIDLRHGPATTLLEGLRLGEHDATLTNAPALESALEQQGLARGRRLIASTGFMLVGPLALLKPLAAGSDVVLALARLAQVQAPFMTRADGSGTHLAEQALWRAAQTAPQAPWYQSAAPGGTLLAQAHAAQACALVEHGVWAAHGGGKGYGV